MTTSATTESVLAAAAKLGEQLSAHPAFAAFRAVAQKIEADTDAQRLLTDLRRHQQALAEKEQSGAPIEVGDKHKLRDLQAAAAGHELLREMQKTEMDYVDLMRQVDAKIAPR